MIGRALPMALLAAAAIWAGPAAACKIAPPATTAEGRAAEAEWARAWQAELDRAEAVFVAAVSGGSGQLGDIAVMTQRLRGTPPARIDVGSRSTCDPVWQAGDRLIIYASRKAGKWTVLRAEPDTPAARAAVRRGRASAPR